MKERWLEREVTRLFVVEDGAGLPVVLLHGGMSNHQGTRAWAAPLAARCRLITPDLRASGRSVFAGELSWDVLADDVAALVPERAVIGGVSFGTGVAVRVALRHPDRVAGLVLIHPVYGSALTPAQAAAMTAMAAAGARGVEGLMSLLD